jgi:hypothetical protein
MSTSKTGKQNEVGEFYQHQYPHLILYSGFPWAETRYGQSMYLAGTRLWILDPLPSTTQRHIHTFIDATYTHAPRTCEVIK